LLEKVIRGITVKMITRSTLKVNRSNEFTTFKIFEEMGENIRAIVKGNRVEKKQGESGGRFLFRSRGHPAAPGVSPL